MMVKWFTLADNQVWTHDDGYLMQNSPQALIKLFNLCRGIKVECGGKAVGKVNAAKIIKDDNNITTLTIRVDFFKKPICIKKDLSVRWYESEYHWERYGENDLCVVDDISTIYSIEVFGNFSDKSNSMKVKPKRARIYKR